MRRHHELVGYLDAHASCLLSFQAVQLKTGALTFWHFKHRLSRKLCLEITCLLHLLAEVSIGRAVMQQHVKTMTMTYGDQSLWPIFSAILNRLKFMGYLIY